MTLSPTDLESIWPGLLLLASGFVVIVLDLVRPGLPAIVRAFAGVLGSAGATGWLANRWWTGAAQVSGFEGTMVLDDLALLGSLGIGMATTLILGLAPIDAVRRRIDVGEYHALLLFSAAGMTWLLSAADFLTLFIALEILSLGVYVLTGVTRRNPRSTEAAMKYLVTGAFATAFLLMGMALVYGATGAIGYDAISAAAAKSDAPILGVGVGLVLVGMLFKLGAVPFHMWVPDVYEGAPTTTTAFMSVAVKAAGFGALVRLLVGAFGSRPDLWVDLVMVVAVATMIVGNLLAVGQASVKRMLAFSSVAHTGYALVALACLVDENGTFHPGGASSALFYVFAYTFMTLGAFVFLVYMGHEAGKEWQDAETYEDLEGLGWRHPWATAGMIVLMCSLGGLPPTAGFLGKLWVLQTAVDHGHVAIAVIAVLASLVSWAYYLRVVIALAMRDPAADDERPHPAVAWVLGAAVAGTLALGLAPGAVVELADRAVVSAGRAAVASR